ncbi:ABC transporter substrate-binding protein [Hippea sp. KM1]|uniref:ABC transporter substrate-binding protein n=1 Tax=Hippea sp. KM1 TaxID=944481 RepID=UPI00046D8E03|nr:ABC transporter substrate-binding protein [Hippea sp. KM1]
MKRFLIALFIILIAQLSAAKPIKVRLKLNWKYQFEFAGYIAAKEKGFYKDAGLDVDIIEYDHGAVVDDVLNGKVEFGVAGSDIFTSIINRKPIVIVANFFKKSPLVLAVKPSILFPKQLNNKVLYCGGTDITLTSVGLLIKKFNIHFKKIIKKKGSYTIKPFIDGKVDAIPIYITNQTYMLNELGIPYNIIDPSNYGIFAYSGNLFTSREFLEKHPDIVKRFTEASIKGWQYALSHKDEIAHIIYNKYSSKKSLKALIFEANMIEDVIMPDVFSLGFIDKNIIKKITSKFAKILNKEPPLNIDEYIKTPHKSALFTKREMEFIKKHPSITYCIRPNLRPVEFIDKDGGAKGISIELLKKISNITHIKFKLLKTRNFNESLRFFREGKCQLLPTMGNKKLLKKQAIFTKPYAKQELFIFSKSNISFVNSLCELKNKIFLEAKYTSPTLIIKEQCPQITIKEFNTFDEVFKRLEEDPNYFCVISPLIASYYIKRYRLKNIKIVGTTNRYIEISMAINKNLPTLASIINKALSKIGKSGIEKISSYQLSKQSQEIYKKRIIQIVSISIIVILFLFWVIRVFYRKNEELLKTKKRLEESLKNFEAIMENSIQMTILIKTDGRCLQFNDMALHSLKYSESELKDKNISDLVPQGETEKIKEAIENRDTFELNLIKKDNTILNTLAKATRIKIKNEEITLITAVDITPIKRLQQQLNNLNRQLSKRVKEETEKNIKKDRMIMQQSKAAALGEMMGMIAHQWRQPINAISATVNNLLIQIQMDRLDSKTLTNKLSNILQYIQHLNATIEDFRNFYKPQTVKEPTNIDELLETLLKIVKDHFVSKNITIKTDFNCSCMINLYGNELKHVILNILNNARDVLIERNIEKPTITITTRAEGNHAVIIITDNGGGIDENVIEHIFDAYFTTKGKKGTGLGLYMSKIIIEEHLNGRIEAYNTEDGAAFKIYLPMK